jgi:SAM-dependent methyltransferase
VAEPDFDKYADSYESDIADALSFVGQDPAFFLELKANAIVDLVRETLGDPSRARILDVGCGHGELDGYLIPSVAELHGVDVAPAMVERAALTNPSARYVAYGGGRLPFDDTSFDLAFASCVLHHVPPPEHLSFVAEMIRVVRPGGLVTILEHNPLNPLTRVVVSRCPFDEEAILLPMSEAAALLRRGGLDRLGRSYIVFFPWRGRMFRRAELSLKRVALGAQYVVSGQKPLAPAAEFENNRAG